MTLSVNGITKTFGSGQAETEVLKGIDFNVNDGEFVILNGASGSGKTTLLTILGGLLTADSGEIIYKDEPLFSVNNKPADLRLTKIGFIFQTAHLVPYLTVQEQLTTLGKEAKMTKKAANEKAQTLLKSIGLGHRLSAFPHMLSGGEKQRVAIMRAFMNDPKIILADEPTASLDANRATEVVKMIKQQIQDNNMIGIMITHDQRLFQYADRIIELDNGRIVNGHKAEVTK